MQTVCLLDFCFCGGWLFFFGFYLFYLIFLIPATWFVCVFSNVTEWDPLHSHSGKLSFHKHHWDLLPKFSATTSGVAVSTSIPGYLPTITLAEVALLISFVRSSVKGNDKRSSHGHCMLHIRTIYILKEWTWSASASITLIRCSGKLVWNFFSFYPQSILGILSPNVKLLIVQKNVPHFSERIFAHTLIISKCQKSIKGVVLTEKLHFQFYFFPQLVQNMCINSRWIYSVITALFFTVLIKTITCSVCIYSHYRYDIIELSGSVYMAFSD